MIQAPSVRRGLFFNYIREVNHMRLGAPVFHCSSAEEWAKKHIEKGYGAAYWPLGPDADSRLEADYRRAAEKHGLVIAEVGIWRNTMDPDPVKQEENIRYSIKCLKLADRIGARCCVNIAGSLSRRWDGPHPDNMTESTMEKIVRITQRIIDEADPKETAFTLEPMPWMYPSDLSSMQELLRRVDRPAMGVHVDMCNMMSGCDRIYRSGAITREFFGALGPKIRSVHAKDVVLHDELTTHISETIPGHGLFDHAELLTQCARLPDICVLCEHLSTPGEYDEATAFLRKTAESLGLSFTV